MNTGSKCAQCEAMAVNETYREQRFVYGDTELTATVPVLECGACGDAYTDWRGEAARETAVRNFLQKDTSHG